MIQIQVRNKVAVNLTPKEIIICGNSGYEVEFQFDAEWEEALVKTARFVYRKDGKNLSIDQPFTGNTVEVPKLSNIHFVMVGVYAGDLKTTTPAVVNCKKSILCGTGKHEEPEPDVYNELIELINTGGASDAIRHSPQELTEEQQEQARKNIGAMPKEGSEEILKYSPQGLTEEQKAQARENIGAISKKEVPSDTVKIVPQELTVEQKEQARENIGAASKKDIEDLDFMPPEGDPEAEVRFDAAHAQMMTAPEFVIADPEKPTESILLTKEGAEEDGEPRKAVMLTDPSGNPVILSNVANPELGTDAANMSWVNKKVNNQIEHAIDVMEKKRIKVSGAEVGQFLKVSAVDEKGEPTAWTTDMVDLSKYATTECVDNIVGNINAILATLSDGGTSGGES